MLKTKAVKLAIENEKPYSKYITLTVILLSFISATTFELYAPSLPMLAKYLDISETMIKNTITVAIIGYSIGSLIFGILIDTFGGIKVLMAALCAFILMSLLAPFVTTIGELMSIRFFQGLLISCAAICSRAFATFYFKDKQFITVILYTTISYSLGLVIGPVIGGYLQFYFGWQSSFYAYATMAMIVVSVIFVFFRDKYLVTPRLLSVKNINSSVWQVLSNQPFLASSGISGLIVVSLMVYPTVGGFLIQDVLGYSSITYGHTAMLISSGYLLGALTNRSLLNILTQKQQLQLGFTLNIIAVLLQYIFSLTLDLKLWTIVFPIFILNYSMGFIQGNMLGIALKSFNKNAGLVSAIQANYVMLIGSIGIFLVSYFRIKCLIDLSNIFLLLMIGKLIIFFRFLQPGYNASNN